MKKELYLISEDEINKIAFELKEYLKLTGKAVYIKIDTEKKRSKDISTRFHSQITNIWHKMAESGQEVSREYIYYSCLIEACSIPDEFLLEGMSPYPYIIVKDALIPKRTSETTNNQMMTALMGVKIFANKNNIIDYEVLR